MVSNKFAPLTILILFITATSGGGKSRELPTMSKLTEELPEVDDVTLLPVTANLTHQLNLTWKSQAPSSGGDVSFVIDIYTRDSPEPRTLNHTVASLTNSSLTNSSLTNSSLTNSSFSHLLTNLLPGEIYKTTVASRKGGKLGRKSEFSNSLRTNPLPPENISYNTTSESIRATWEQPDNSVFDYYHLVIYYKTVFLDKGGLEYTRTGLSPNRKYDVKLRCYSLETSDEFDADAKYSQQIDHQVYTRPEKPILKSASLVPDHRTTSILVHFEPSDGGADNYVIIITPIGESSVESSGDDGDGSVEITTSTTLTQVDDLQVGGEYSVGVKAEGKGGRSLMSNEEAITMSPPQPYNITLEETRTSPSTQMIVRWNMPDMEYVLSGYFIEITNNRLTTEETYNLHTTTATTNNKHKIDNLTPGTLYTVRVTCYSGLTLSYASRESEAKGTSLPIPTDVQLLQSHTRPTTELNITWSMPAYEYIVTSYEVAVYSEQSTSPQLRLRESGNETLVENYFILNNLTPGESYKVAVRCLGLTSGEYSRRSKVQKTDPLPPEDFRMSEQFPAQSADFIWHRPRANSTITSYYLRDDVTEQHILARDDDVGEYHLMLCCLAGNTEFRFSIKSCSNETSNESWAVVRTCSVETSLYFHTAPGLPSDIRLHASPVSPSTEIEVDFTEPLGGADEYIAKLGSLFTGETTNFTSPTSPIVMTSLFPGGTYDVIVCARSDVSGKGNFSETNEITTAPLPVRDLEPRNGSGSTPDIRLTWKLPDPSESFFTSLSVMITDISNNLTEEFLLSSSATECVVPSSHLGKHLCAAVITVSGTVESSPVSVNFTYVESHVVAPETSSSKQQDKTVFSVSLLVALIFGFAILVLVVAVLVALRLQKRKRKPRPRR